MSARLRFGIMSTGNIAQQFAQGLAGSQRSVGAAVGSRNEASAKDFASRYAIPRAHGSYEALLADDEVDAIYLALPNSMHHEWTLKALAAGKHVLCEKPLANDAAQAQGMFDAARKHGRLLVEAFMYRSHPLTTAWRDAIARGDIGQVRDIRASFCYFAAKPQGNIRFDAGLHGGALMDVGCYCVNFARLVAGAEPVKMHAVGKLHETGVDELTSATLLFPGGVTASFTCGMRLHADNAAMICGDAGYLKIPVPWKPPVKGAEYLLKRSTPPRMDQLAGAGQVNTGGGGGADGKPVADGPVRVDSPGPLYGLEADAFAAAALDGAIPAITEADTMGNMRVLDELRRQVGLAY